MSKISIPFMLRELTSQIGQALRLSLGVPMNAEFPPSTDEESEGTAVIHFPGRHFVTRLLTGRGHYGQYINIETITATLSFDSREEAKQWIENLQSFSGPTEWSYDNGKLRFSLAGKRLARLSMNASARRNGQQEYKWDDPEHPWIIWGQQTNNPSYPNLPE